MSSPAENKEPPERNNSIMPGSSFENKELSARDSSAMISASAVSKKRPEKDPSTVADTSAVNIEPSAKDNSSVPSVSTVNKEPSEKVPSTLDASPVIVPGASLVDKNPQENVFAVPASPAVSKTSPRKAVKRKRAVLTRIQLTPEQQYQMDLTKYKRMKAEVMKDMARHLKTPFVKKNYDYYKNGISPENFKRFELQIYSACLAPPYPL